MSRPRPPFFAGATRPGAVGWTRIGVSAAMALVVLGLGLAAPTALPPVLAIAAAAVIGATALWSWMRLWTRFLVDEHGVTISYGGFWPQRPWPLAEFRTVQLREVPGSVLGATVGPLGRSRALVLTGTREERRPVAGRPVHVPAEDRVRCRLQVSAPGTLVEIIGREGTHFLLSPTDPEATARAVDQAIRSRR